MHTDTGSIPRMIFFVYLSVAYLFFFIGALSTVRAQETSFNDKEYLKIDADISSTIDIVKTGSNPYLQYVMADLFFHPISDERLEILSINSSPASESQGEKLRFVWLSPKQSTLQFSVTSTLKSKTIETPVISKIQLPLSYTPPEVSAYLAETPTVDFNTPEIRGISEQLATDEEDLFFFATKAASFVRNTISYNLSTITAKATKPASWVLEKKQGVCDELTNLFIAIMRAQGIPARFISGLAYTNSRDFPEKWGGHGWAEVYFPGYGWVPFDTTFGQFGWLDPSHIKLKEGADATEASTNYEWRGQNINLGIHPLTMTADIIETGPTLRSPFTLTVKPERDQTGIGSHNVILASVSNKDNRYHTLDLSLGSTDGLTILDDHRKDIALKPFEKKTIAWTVRVKDGLKPDYIYTFPIIVYSQRNINATSSFNASIKDPLLYKEEADIIQAAATRGSISRVQLSCQPSTPTPKQGKPFDISCRIDAPGAGLAGPALLCADQTCVNVTTRDARISATKQTPGRQETLVTLLYEEIPAYTTITYTVIDEPRMSIHAVQAPPYINYDDSFNLTINIRHESLARALDPSLTASVPGLEKTWPVPPAPETVFTIQMKGADIAGIDGINVTLTYTGEDGQTRTDMRMVSVYVTDISAWQSLRMAFARFSQWIYQWFLGEDE